MAARNNEWLLAEKKRRWTEYHAMADAGAKKAIAHYQVKKDQFIQSARTAVGKDVSNFAEELWKAQQAMIVDDARKTVLLSSSTSSQQLTLGDLIKICEDWGLKLVNNITKSEYATWSNKLSFDKLKGKQLSDYEKIKSVSKNHRKDLNEFINNQIKHNLNGSILLNKIFNKTALSNNTALLDQMRAYIRRLFIMTINNKTDVDIHLSEYIKTSSGIINEATLANLGSNLFGKLNSAIQWGADTSEKGVMGKADVALLPWLGTFKKVPKTISATGKFELAWVPAYTLQSKSWDIPWLMELDQLFKGGRAMNLMSFPISRDASHYPKGDGQYWWHAGYASLMADLTNVLGPSNLLFSGKFSQKVNQIYWMNDFISEMVKNKFVIAYYKYKTDKKGNKDQLSKSTYLMYHDDDNA